MTTTTTHTNNQLPTTPDQPTRIFAQWGLPHTVTPLFSTRLIQGQPFLPDRASLIGEWEEEAIDHLEDVFPALIKELEGKRLSGELDAYRQQRSTIQHGDFIGEADNLESHGYVYLTIYRTAYANL